MTATICDLKYSTAARQIVLKVICETIFLVSKQEAGVIEVNRLENLAKNSCVHDR